jgi:hypothetical protein
MLESSGLITIAFRQTFVESAVSRKGADLPNTPEQPLSAHSTTSSPYFQIEPAIAYQIGLPSLILRERGVTADGLLDRGIVGIYMPEFSLDISPTDYLRSYEWTDLVGKWEGYVRAVVDARGTQPKLF